MSVELADIVRLFGQDYCHRFAASLLPSHRKALRDIARCRTPELGGQLFQCANCDKHRYSYHSCNNRHCPKCQNDAATHWVQHQQSRLLLVPYFFATFTLPEEFNPIAFAHQRKFYHAFFRASSQALCAQDPRFLGAHIGFFGVFQSWTRDLRYHPHIHFIIPAGGLSFDKKSWASPKNNNFLVHVKPLARLFRGKMKDALNKAGLLHEVPSSVWDKNWVVHILPAGSGLEVIKYLAPYVSRVALSNNRILRLNGRLVTFKFKDAQTNRWKFKTLDALDFIHSFLQHVLPRSFVKIRSYGFLAPNQTRLLHSIQNKLLLSHPSENIITDDVHVGSHQDKHQKCPSCGGDLIFVALIPRADGSRDHGSRPRGPQKGVPP